MPVNSKILNLFQCGFFLKNYYSLPLDVDFGKGIVKVA